MSPGRFTLHPVIRVVGFLVIGSSLALGGTPELLLASVVLACLYLFVRRTEEHGSQSQGLWRMLRRMRWLFLSLLIIYFWFTPGQPLLPLYGMPTREGIAAGVVRVASLVMLVAAVHLLLCTTSREQLVTAIHWLARPLTILGLSADRLALRIVLTLENVVEAQHLLGQYKPAVSASGHSIVRIGASAAGLFQQILKRAEAAPLVDVALSDDVRPPLYQWCYPLILGVLFWWVR